MRECSSHKEADFYLRCFNGSVVGGGGGGVDSCGAGGVRGVRQAGSGDYGVL